MRNRGFIGLLALLIGIAIIALLVVRTDLFQKTKTINENGEVEEVEGQNILEQGQSAIKKAKDAKTLLEERSRQDGELAE